MAFSDEAARAIGFAFSPQMAESITYNGAGIRGHLEEIEVTDPRSGSVTRRAVLEVLKSSVAIPTHRDTAVVGGTTWRVDGIAGSDAWTWSLNVYTDERPAR